MNFMICLFLIALASCQQVPYGLRIEYLHDNPLLGLDVESPRFQWYLDHTQRGQNQTSYQVSSNEIEILILMLIHFLF